LRISQTVEAATFTPTTRSSPWMRRYPQPDHLSRSGITEGHFRSRALADTREFDFTVLPVEQA
jgi:hypothetical protein